MAVFWPSESALGELLKRRNWDDAGVYFYVRGRAVYLFESALGSFLREGFILRKGGSQSKQEDNLTRALCEIKSNALEFLIHGAKYSFPAQLGRPRQGVATADPFRDKYCERRKVGGIFRRN